MARVVAVLVAASTTAGRAQSDSPKASTSPPPAAAAPDRLPVSRDTPSLTRPEFPAPAADPVFDLSKSHLPAGIRLSYWTGEMVKLAQAGIDDGVMLAFVDAAGTFNLAANDIIYLSDLGVPASVVSAMLQHDLDFALGDRPADGWVMPLAPPSVHLHFLTNATVTASAPAATAPVSEADSAVAAPEFPSLEMVEATADPLEPPAPHAIATRALTAKPVLYAIREPYAEQVTQPILVFRMPGRLPNIQVLEPFP